MKNGPLKALARIVFRDGSTWPILIGPLRGCRYRISRHTGLSPLYSGHERDHQWKFRQLAPEGGVVLDVGAHWGSHSLLLSKFVGPTGRVLAFEPFPEAVAELTFHMALNDRKNVEIVPVALSSEDGTASFRVSTSTSQGSLVLPTNTSDEIAVPTRRLDGIVRERNLSRVDLIKIDVEGAESLVLAGAVETVEKFRPAFVIDLHTPEQDLAVAKFLTSRGYRLSRISGPPIRNESTGWPDPEGVWGTIVASVDRR